MMSEVVGFNQNPQADQVKITLSEYQGDQWAFLEGSIEQFKSLWESIGEMFDFEEDEEIAE